MRFMPSLRWASYLYEIHAVLAPCRIAVFLIEELLITEIPAPASHYYLNVDEVPMQKHAMTNTAARVLMRWCTRKHL